MPGQIPGVRGSLQESGIFAVAAGTGTDSGEQEEVCHADLEERTGGNAVNEVVYSSRTDLWETPQGFFDALDKEFHFDLDVCAISENAKCKRFFTPEMDGLKQDWTGMVWCNPPYGRKVGEWVQKAAESNCTVVMLLPARTDTKWFHDYIYGKAEIRFVRGRLKFGGAENAAPFPSMVVVFRRERGE